MISCASCGVSTGNPRFCSRQCAARVTNRETIKRPRRMRTCIDCDASFYHPTRSRKRCEICRGRADLRNKPLSAFLHPSNERHRAWKFSDIRADARRRYADELLQGCEICGYSIHVEIAHVAAVRSFPLTATVGEVNARSNVRFLCPNHHWEFDHLPRVSSPGFEPGPGVSETPMVSTSTTMTRARQDSNPQVRA